MHTEEILNQLAKEFPETSLDALVEILLACNGNIHDTRCILKDNLKAYLAANKNANINANKNANTNSKGNGFPKKPPVYLQQKLKKKINENIIYKQEYKQKWMTNYSKTNRQSCLENYIKIPKNIHNNVSFKKNEIIHLYSPRSVEDNLFSTVSFFTNILPIDIADELLSTMIFESNSWESYSSFIAGREVKSNHSTCLYLSDELNSSKNVKEMDSKKYSTYSEDGSNLNKMDNNSDYYYTRKYKIIPPILNKAKNIIDKFISDTVNTHPAYKGDNLTRNINWKSTATVCNYYKDSKSSVGWHSDNLTHIGPKAIIASLSLGAGREFRLRRIVSESGKNNNPNNTYSIHLEHNSLVIMHAGCQEHWKHTVPPVKTVENNIISDSGRINITFRMYRKELEPDKIPKCKTCYRHLLLRAAYKKNGDYFWSCPRHETSFVWADKDGIPRSTCQDSSVQ